MTSVGIGLKDAQRSEVNVSYRIRATENGSRFEAVVRMELYVSTSKCAYFRTRLVSLVTTKLVSVIIVKDGLSRRIQEL